MKYILVQVNIIAPDSHPVRSSILDGQNGKYKCLWKPAVEGEHIINVTIKDLHLPDSPFKVNVRAGRDYNTIGLCKFQFGGEGETEGNLCRPWGACCSREGYILVANRCVIVRWRWSLRI